MPLITCPDCQNEISDAAPACIHCGRPAARPEYDPGVEGYCANCGDALLTGEAIEYDGRLWCSDDYRAITGGGRPYAHVPAERGFNPGVAAVLSLVLPGAGQMYRGKIGRGLLWLVFVPLGYMAFVLPGLVLHLLCILNAAKRP